jgi:serine/threonine protein kinase
MSPEQARGHNADHRSDIFSMGCILYEMFTGRQAFDGDEISDILASVLKTEPDLAALPPNVSTRIRALPVPCLEKNPKRRWQAIGDLRIEIENALANPVPDWEFSRIEFTSQLRPSPGASRLPLPMGEGLFFQIAAHRYADCRRCVPVL